MSKSNQKGVTTFTLDFSKWCVGSFERDGKYCAAQQAIYSGCKITSCDMHDIADINDAHISRENKVKLLRKKFKKLGIRMNVKNFNYGLKKE